MANSSKRVLYGTFNESESKSPDNNSTKRVLYGTITEEAVLKEQLQNRMKSNVSEVIRPTFKGIKEQMKIIENKTTIPSVYYDEEYAKELQLKKEYEEAKRAWEDWKEEDYSILAKGLDYLGNPYVTQLRNDYLSKEKEYENFKKTRYYSAMPNGEAKTTNPKNKLIPSSADKNIDWRHEYINNFNDYQEHYMPNPYSENYGKYYYMTEREKGIYNYLYNIDFKKAEEFLKFIDDDLEKRLTQKSVENAYKFTSKNADTAALGSVASIPINIVAAGEQVKNMANYLVTGEMKENSASQIANAMRAAVTDKYDLEIGNWDAFDFVYNTLMSGADSLAAAGMGSVGAVSLGLSAAANSTNDILQRGGTAEQAFWGGVASGVFEGFFEKYSIGQLNAMKDSVGSGFKVYANNIAKSMLVNVSEETATEVANILYDYAANGGISQYAKLIEEYKQNNPKASEKSARDYAAKQLGIQIIEAGASGALMGFGFGGAGSIFNYKNADSIGKIVAANGMENQILDLALKTDKNSNAYRLADKIIKSGNMNSAQIGTVAVETMTEFSNKKTTITSDAVYNRIIDLGLNKENAAKITKNFVAFLNDKNSKDEFRNKVLSEPVMKQIISEMKNPEGNSWVTEMTGEIAVVENAISQIKNATSFSQNTQLQTDSEGGIINQGGEEDGRIYNQGRMDGSFEEQSGINTATKGQVKRIGTTVEEYVSGGKAKILSGDKGKVPRRILINHTENSSVTFTEGTEDGTDGYKVYTAFVNAGIKVIYCQGPIERTVNGVTVSRTEAFTAPDGTVYISSESSIPPKQTFDHEKVHVADKTNNPAYSDYETVLCNEVDYLSDTYLTIAGKINKNQFNNKYDIEDISTYPIFMREIAAYVNQFVLSDPNFAEQTFGGMFSDWGTVVEAVNKFNTDMGADLNGPANFMPDGESEGGVGLADGEIADFGGIDTSKGKHLDKAQQDEITAIGEKLGRKVVYENFYNLDKFKGKKKIPDGYIDKDGNVHINYYAKRPVYFLFKHEITHYLKRSLASYNDFMNLVIDSNAFKDWLNKKGYSSIDTLKTEIMDTYSEVEGFNETKCYDEILANFVGEYLFGGENAINQNLIDALEPKQKKTFMDVIKGIIDYLKSKFQKNKPIQTEIDKIENEFIKVYKEAVEVKVDEGSADISEYEYINPINVTETDISQNLIDISKMESVCNMTGQEFTKGEKDLVTQVDEFFSEYNYSIENSLLGDVDITARGAKDSIAHGIGRNKAVAFTAVPDVIQKGKIIDYQKNWKNRGYDTIVLAAPVTINKEPYYEGVIVIRDSKTQRFYVHEVITEKRTDTSFKTGANKNVGKSGDISSPSIISLLDKIREVKENLTFEEVDNNNSIQENEDYSIPSSTIDRKSILTDLVNGEITVEEAEKLLSGKKTLNPVEIANLTEESANTEVPLTKKKGEAKGDKQSKFYGSIQKSELFGEEFKQEAASDKFIEKYKSVTNKETLQMAAKELEEGGQEYVEKWLTIKPERANLVDTAVGFILMDRYQRAGKIEQAVAVAEKVREFGTASGQQVQIFSIIGRFDPDMMVAYAKKELSQAFETMIKGKTNKWIDKNKEKFQLTEEDIEFIRRRTLQAAMFEDGTRQKAVALAEIQKTIQDKIPPESGDSIRALQRISMLLNPKTNERNIIGNAGMVGVFVASDVFGSGIDKIVSQKTGVRTTGNFDVKSVSGIKKGLYESYDDFKRGIRTKQEELNRFDTTVSRGNKNFNENGSGIFGTKVLKKQLNDVAKILNKIDNFTSFCLEAGDRPFFEMWYMNSLNTQLKLNNSEFPTTEMMEIAKEEALKRTWQDDNVYTRALSNLKKNVNIIHIPGTSYGLGDFIFKFVKTPTNLAKAIVEFSPLGFAGATSNAIKLKNAIETNQFNAQLQKEFVTSASNAITGTLVYALVAIGAALGIVKLSGDGDEDKDVSNYEKYIMGIPPYSIEFLGTNMTYDWMQPFGSVLATVADFIQTKKEQPDLKTSSVIWEAIKAGGKTFTKQSFLQSMYDFFSQDDIVDGISSLVLSEPSAFIPQAFSQLASYLDKYRRTTYDATNAFQTSINKIIAKIPGLRTRLPKQVNVLGEDVKNTQYLNVWEAFASPWNTYPKSSNEIVGEIYDLYKKTGEDSVMPRTVPNYLTVKGNKITFSPEEKAQFQRDIGQSSAEMLAILFDNSEYKKLSDNEKTDVVSKIYEFAYAKSKSAIKYDYETLSAMAGEKKNGDPVLSKSDYKKLPEKARQIIAQEYFLSKAEVRYIDNYNMLIQSFIKKVKE